MYRKKVLAIVSNNINETFYYKKQLDSLFDDKIAIKEIFVAKNASISEMDLNFDVALICSAEIFDLLKPYVDKNIPLVMYKRTITKTAYNLICKIPKGSNIAVYGYDYEIEFFISRRLHMIGINDINFFPYKRNKNIISQMDGVIVLDDESNKKYLDIEHKNLLFIGYCLLDVSNLVDLSIKLGLEDYIFTKDISTTFEELVSADFSLTNTLKRAKLSDSYLNVLLDMINKGVLGIDFNGSAKIYNDEARELLQLDAIKIINSNAFELFPFIPFKQVLTEGQKIENYIYPYQDNHLIISVTPMSHSGKITGAIATFKKYTDTEKEQNIIRTKILKKGHFAKYTFCDIISTSAEMDKCKAKAKTMAQSNSTVLITGESGTGKELFAHSIHNYSYRKEQPFVAINCGILPESLLESELFGYEEGAFTGSKKGGKRGLFEIAHKGTIFLDEISEIPQYIQLKLLRVIQEREIMRVGGDDLIKIDIRIIAATNRNLKREVEEGNFRADLYYRINVLPLNIPPLRARKDDILPLINYFKEKYKAGFTLSLAAEEIIKNYIWNGNVRELENLVEYLSCLNLKRVEVDDLPLELVKDKHNYIKKTGNNIINKFLVSVSGKIENYIFVLSELEQAHKNNINIGRRNIYTISKEKGFNLSEHEIRRIIKELELYSMISIYRGKGGTKISQLGIDTLNFLKNFSESSYF